MRDAAYIKYLETLALSAIALADHDELPNIEDPEISFSIYNALLCIKMHREERTKVVPSKPHTLVMIGSTGSYDAFLDVDPAKALKIMQEEYPGYTEKDISSFMFQTRFSVYDAWHEPAKDKAPE